MAVPGCVPPARNEFLLSPSSPAVGVVSAPDVGYSIGLEVSSPCCSGVHLPGGAPFHRPICHLCIFFGKVCPLRSLTQFLTRLLVFFMLSFKGSLYIWDNGHLLFLLPTFLYMQSTGFRVHWQKKQEQLGYWFKTSSNNPSHL